MKTAKKFIEAFEEDKLPIHPFWSILASLEEKIELMDGAFNELFHDIGQRLVKLESKDINPELISIDIK